MERTALFRGVEFSYDTIRVFNIGRRGQECEYLYRDETGYEDLGKSAFRIEVTGEWCSGDRDDIEALRAAIEAEGPGEFIDPLWGVLDVVALPTSEFEVSAQYDEYARFRLEFRETGEFRFPSASSGSAGLDSTAVLATLPTLSGQGDISAFAAASLGAGSLGWVATEGTLHDSYPFSAYTILTGMQSFPSQYLIRPDAGDLVAGIIEAIAIGHPDKAQGLQFLIDTYSGFSTAIPPTVNTTFAQADYQAALDFDTYVRLAALTQAILLLQEVEFVSTADAKDIRDQLLAWIDAEIRDCENFAELMRLRSDMLILVGERLPGLPGIRTKCFEESLPAVVVAHRIFGDYTRWKEIWQQNPSQSPLFMNELIEVVDA